MESIDYTILSRSLERIVATLLGGGIIYLGYRIFLNLPNISTLEDNFKFKKYLSFNVTKIGAATVFMIFGSFIILSNILEPVTYKNEANTATESYSGISERTQEELWEDDFIDYRRIPEYFGTLNRILDMLDPNTEPRDFTDVEITISRVKLNLMMATWREGEWGDKVSFREWVIKGATGPKPEGVNQAALDYFLSQ